ncbi:uncharacterized protein LOC128392084 isoform X1 [Panonychus citri]|uniref:uncharacterized protein LOC128392084 isoform X1 n=1 Tax=Panonychus citri TaxID=50023 RepID=UPI002307907D|nr:uncharacterized protein LOC128392084 isoform X1 [Panonychus citri]
MAKVTSNQSIVKLDCGHDQSSVFYVHKCLRTFCEKCKRENRSCVLCKSELVETDYLKAIDTPDTDDQTCSKCNNCIAEFVDKTTNEFFCASCNQDNNSVNIVPIELDNNNNDTNNINIAENVEIYRVYVQKRLDLLNTKLKEYRIEIENERAEFNKGIGHMRSKLKSYLSVNKVKTDSLRAEVNKVKQFSNQLNRNDKFGIIDIIESTKLNNEHADSKLKLWVKEIVQSYVIPELIKSGVDWTKESERAFHELIPGPRNWKLNHGPFFPDNLIKLTYDVIKEQIFHRNVCRASSCYCGHNNLFKKFYVLKTECELSQNNLDYFLDCSSIAGGDVTLMIETGKRALNQSDFLVARVCCEEAHRISPNNWIVLDTLMGLYFVLDDFSNCLKLAIKGLTADCNYFKARVLIEVILKSLPTLKSEIPVGLDYLLDCRAASDKTRRTKILDELKKMKQLRDKQKKTETQQENVRKSLQSDLNTETMSLESLISALITVNRGMEKQRLNLSTSKITGNPLSNLRPSSKEKQNNKRKCQGHDPPAKRDKKIDETIDEIDETVEIMFQRIFYMLPESISTPEIVQEDELQMETQNEAQVENLILTQFLSKQKSSVSKGKQIHLLIPDLLYEIASEATTVRLPSNFMDLYGIHRKWKKLPTPLTCSVEDISVDTTNLILIANEVQFDETEAIFLTESIPYLRDLMSPNDYDKFFIRLLILRGIKESKVDYLLMANEILTKTNLKSVQAANQTVYTSSSLRSMINNMNENNFDTLLDQHRHEEIVELLASKSELSKQEEKYFCQAIRSSQQWKRGIEILSQSNQYTHQMLNLLRSCLKNGELSINRELAIKLLKLGTEDYNAIAWTCILQVFINEMRLGNTGEEKVVDLIDSVHFYLGDNGACYHSNGKFLSLSLDFLVNKSNIKREKLILNCLGCFYKRLKCSLLSAHQGAGLNLRWKDVDIIYNFFIPKTLPTFTSEISKSIDLNTAKLLCNLLPLIPDNLNPERFSNSVKEYVDHGKPIEPSSSIPKDHVTRDLYYYLADYYLKNEEFKKAVQFYFLDLTLNLNRIDSWAGCALAITSQIDQYFSTNCHVIYSSMKRVFFMGGRVCKLFNKAIGLRERIQGMVRIWKVRL